IFIFQAEDGIRYRNVTGVQTCALPIYNHRHQRSESVRLLTCLTLNAPKINPIRFRSESLPPYQSRRLFVSSSTTSMCQTSLKSEYMEGSRYMKNGTACSK